MIKARPATFVYKLTHIRREERVWNRTCTNLGMRWMIPALACLGLALTSCNQTYDRQPDTREAGRQAYRASQELKKDAKQAAQDLRQAGKNFREGWNEAEREEKVRKKDSADRSQSH